tara:strand:+ start:72 stop:899 length:828 start_codon:yes stop_codon:yes gene_type:complete
MGLGGYLTWTALAREIKNRHNVKVIPVEVHGGITKLIKSQIFYNNSNFIQDFNNDAGLQIVLNNPQTNYCEKDTPTKVFHKSNKHIIETICNAYGIKNPELKCDLFLDKQENSVVNTIYQKLPNEFLTIEPFSKSNYTQNRAYPIEKFQKVVDKLYNDIPIVQIGLPGPTRLENVIDLTGKTTFREAAGVIGKSRLFIATESGLVHASTAVKTKSIVIITGYQTERMVAYPQNINVNISKHGPCGLKVTCEVCKEEAIKHDEQEIVSIIRGELCL